MSLQACADLVWRGDPDRFRAAMSAPVAARRVLFPIFAFNVEVSRAPWVTEETMIAEMRLQWWRDALDEIASGGPVRKHEVVGPLAAILDATGAALLDDLVLARRWDVYRDPFPDTAAFENYVERTSGDLTWVAARALGGRTRAPYQNLGYATGVAGFLRAVPDLLGRGRVPLVQDDDAWIRATALSGLERLKSARQARRDVPRMTVPALRHGWQAGAVLRRAARRPEVVRKGGLAPSALSSRARMAWLATTGGW
ncbi:MAG: squalene/phytoene synthase family protein [Pseudomonadota bacterium]